MGDRLSFDGGFVFEGGIDLGDAALVDGGFVYAYGHPPDATGLEAQMVVGRAALGDIDDPAAWIILGDGGWGIHRELLDPMDPSAVIVSYSIGSTSADQSERRARDPDAYWPRIVRLRL